VSHYSCSSWIAAWAATIQYEQLCAWATIESQVCNEFDTHMINFYTYLVRRAKLGSIGWV
jgi:hypothetical protein